MKKYDRLTTTNLYYILYSLLIGDSVKSICEKKYDLKKYSAIYKSYTNLQKKVFDKFLLFNIPLSDKLINTKKINKKYICMLHFPKNHPVLSK